MDSNREFKIQQFKCDSAVISYAVYSSADIPSPDGKTLGDIYLHDGQVFVFSARGWQACTVDGDVRGLTRHPLYNDRVLHVKGGACTWATPSALRSARYRNNRNTGNMRDGMVDNDATNPERKMVVNLSGTSPFSPVLTTSFVSDTSTTKWLKNLRDRWTQTPIDLLPKAKQGIQVLDALLMLSGEIGRFLGFIPYDEVCSTGPTPTLAHVISDILNSPGPTLSAVDHGIGQDVSGLSKNDLIATLLASSCPVEWTDSLRLYSVVTIPFQSVGLQLCNLVIPKSVMVDAITGKESRQPQWSSSLCSVGSLTDVHLDRHGSARLIVNIQSDQLWLLWPATRYNLDWWNAHHTRVTVGNITLDAVGGLEGMEVLHLKGQQALIIPPYSLRAVFTFDVSAYAGVPLWGYKWLKQFQEGTKWEINQACNHSLYGNTAEDAKRDLVTIRNKGLKMWKRVVKRFPQHEDREKTVKWISQSEEKLLKALDGIGTLIAPGSTDVSVNGKTGSKRPRGSENNNEIGKNISGEVSRVEGHGAVPLGPQQDEADKIWKRKKKRSKTVGDAE